MRTRNSVDDDYELFIRRGHIEPLTLFGYFPALGLAAIWLIAARVNVVPHGYWGIVFICASSVSVTFASIYGLVGFGMGWRDAMGVLRGTRPLAATAAVVIIGFVITSGFYAFMHRGIAPNSGVYPGLEQALLVAQLCFFSPVSEELAMQGFVQTRLYRFGIVPSLILTTSLFVIMHLTEIPVAPTLADVTHVFVFYTPTLFVYALVRQITGSLLAAIAVHALNNLAIIFVFAR